MITIRFLGPVGSCVAGIAVARVRTIMSMGFSNTVVRASTLVISFCGFTTEGFRSLIIVVSVISANGVLWRVDCAGVLCRVTSGDSEGSGVGMEEDLDSRSAEGLLMPEILLVLAARTLCLFFGEAFFVGDADSAAALSGVNISVGSIDSMVRVFLALVAVRGVGGTSVVLRREERAALFLGAGVNSSSLSSSCCCWFSSSSSDESMTGALLRVAAARRVGLVGDAADILCG